MAKELLQVVTQDNLQGQFGPIEKRVIVQYNDMESGEQNQVLVNYDDMTTEAKAIYDTFIQMCEAYMNA